MDDIQDFITDHHYNQAIRKKSVVSPEDAVAEAVLDTWPPLPKELANAETLEAFTSRLELDEVYATPVGRYFLIEKLLQNEKIRESDIDPLGKVVRTLEDFHLEKDQSMMLVERFVNKLSKPLKAIESITPFKDSRKQLNEKLAKLREEYDAKRKELLQDADDEDREQKGEDEDDMVEGKEGDDSQPTAAGDTEQETDEREEEEEPKETIKLSTENSGAKMFSGTESYSSRSQKSKSPSKAALARMATLNSSRLSGVEITDITDEKIQALVAVEEYFATPFKNFFSDLDAKLKEFFNSIFPEMKADPLCVTRFRHLQWYACQKEVHMNDFVIFRDLGRGAFGVVSGARHRITGQLVALKGMNRKLVKGKKVLKLVKQEFEILKKLGEFPSPFCVSLSYAFMEETDMYFGLPLMTGGDLMYHICREQRGYGLERARFFAAEILLGVQHMHNLGIIYRDLKPENVLLDENGHTKISDMGLAVLVKFTPYTRGNKLIRGRAGTPGYWPPEMIKGEGYAFDADWWSWAVMLYEFLVGVCPFSEHHTKLKDRNDATLNWQIQYPDVGDEPFPEDAKNLLGMMLERDRYKRLGTQPDTAEQIKAHPFFKDIDWSMMESGRAAPPWKPPNNAINAASQADLETRNKEAKFKKIVLTDEDKIDGFNFKSREHLYDVELVLHLERKGKLDHLKQKKSQHCTIL